MKRRMRTTERGFTVLETTMSLLLAVLVVAVAFSAVAGIQRASSRAQPDLKRVWNRGAALFELESSLADAAAKICYFDYDATVAPVMADTNAATSTSTTATHSYSLAPVMSYGPGVMCGSIAIAGPAVTFDQAHKIFADQVGSSLTLLRADPRTPPLHLGGVWFSKSAGISFVVRDAAGAAAVTGLESGDVLLVNGKTDKGEPATALARLTASPVAASGPSPLRADGTPIFTYYTATIAPSTDTYAFGLKNNATSAAGVNILADATVALLDRDAPVVTYYTRSSSGTTSLERVVGDPASPTSFDAVVDRAKAALAVTFETAAQNYTIPMTMTGTVSFPANTKYVGGVIFATTNIYSNYLKQQNVTWPYALTLHVGDKLPGGFVLPNGASVPSGLPSLPGQSVADRLQAVSFAVPISMDERSTGGQAVESRIELLNGENTRDDVTFTWDTVAAPSGAS